MPESQLKVVVDLLLDPADDDIHVECRAIWECVSSLKAKHGSVSKRAQRLKTEAVARKVEFTHLNSQNRHLRNTNKMMGHKVRSSNGRERKSKDEIKWLRRLCNQKLVASLELACQELEKVNHLRCDICKQNFKEIMVVCGHCFCKECLSTWLQQPKDGRVADERGSCCPMCRRVVRDDDIRALYLGPDMQSDDIAEDHKTVDIVSLDSDSEEESLQR